MSIPQDSPWRGCAANFPQPVDELAAQNLAVTVYYFNCRIGDSPLHNIAYRSSSREEDIVRHVFRWDLTPYEEIFQNGFQLRRQQGSTTPDEVYFNLDHYVRHHHGHRPLDSRNPATHAFVSTTINSSWHPSLNTTEDEVEAYRYEIYAPGGIWVAVTLGDRYQFPAQDEVCFVAGITPQYIRSAQRFRLISDATGNTRRVRVDNVIRVNGNFNPQSHPPRLLRIERPVFDYVTDDGKSRQNLTICRYNAGPKRQQEKRQGVSIDDDSATIDWYAGNVANSESYIDAAFCSSRRNEAYLFMKNEYVLLDYAPGTSDDKILNGPLLICDGYPSLKGTAFAEHGIDCAFGSSEKNTAFIFSGNLCAVIDYAPGTCDDWIKKGPMTIIAMFPFMKRTVFESGIDAAFHSMKEHEAYLFKGNQYALINYGPDCRLIRHRLISQDFPNFRSTIFESGIDAAFVASHTNNKAYIFKGDSYGIIDYAPASAAKIDKKGIRAYWPSLKGILPRKNRGLDS